MTTKEAAALWHITQRQVQIHCKNDRIPGVTKIGNTYLIPTNAQRPLMDIIMNLQMIKYMIAKTVPFLSKMKHRKNR